MQSLETCKLPVNILEHMFLHLLVLLYIIFTFHIFCLVLSIESWSMFDGLPPIFLESLIEERKISQSILSFLMKPPLLRLEGLGSQIVIHHIYPKSVLSIVNKIILVFWLLNLNIVSLSLYSYSQGDKYSL